MARDKAGKKRMEGGVRLQCGNGGREPEHAEQGGGGPGGRGRRWWRPRVVSGRGSEGEGVRYGEERWS
jgi:hypothetical protein